MSVRKIKPLAPALKRIRARQPIRVKRVAIGSGNVGMTWTDGFMILAFGAMCGFVSDYGARLVTVPTIRETKFEYIRTVDSDLTARAVAAANARCTAPATEREQVPGVRTVESGGYPDAKPSNRPTPSKWHGYHSNSRRR
jgi:hypothetical protein